MREIGVVHMDLMSKGGGEAVAMNVLEALQDDYEVTLLTLTDPASKNSTTTSTPTSRMWTFAVRAVWRRHSTGRAV